MSSPRQRGTGLPPQSQPQHTQNTQLSQPHHQQQQPQTMVPCQSVYSPIPFIGPSVPVHPIIHHHHFGTFTNPNFYMSSQSSYIVGAGVPIHLPISAPSAPFGFGATTTLGATLSVDPTQTFQATPIATLPTSQQHEHAPKELPAATNQRGIQPLDDHEERRSVLSNAESGQGSGIRLPPPPSFPLNTHAQDVPEPPRRTVRPAADLPASIGIPTPLHSSRATLLETILHIDKPRANLRVGEQHRTLISADSHWLCMLEESSPLIDSDLQEGVARDSMWHLCLHLQFCPDPHMTEFHKHALQFTALQIVAYGSQQVELTQRISGHDLVNRGVNVYIDPRLVLYNNMSCYGFSVVFSNQSMCQLATIPRPLSSSSIASTRMSADADPSLGASLDVQLTSAYCRRNLAIMFSDTATADTVVRVLNPNQAASPSPHLTASMTTDPTQTSSYPVDAPQQYSRYHTVMSQRYPTQQQQEPTPNAIRHQQQQHPLESSRPRWHTNTHSQQHSMHQQEVTSPQAHGPNAAVTVLPAGTPGSYQGVPHTTQTIATATTAPYEHGVQEVPSHALPHEITGAEGQRRQASTVASPPALLARPLATPPPQHRTVSPPPPPAAETAWQHYRQHPQQPLQQQQYRQYHLQQYHYQQYQQHASSVQHQNQTPVSHRPQVHLQAPVGQNPPHYPPPTHLPSAHGSPPQIYQSGLPIPQQPPQQQSQPQAQAQAQPRPQLQPQQPQSQSHSHSLQPEVSVELKAHYVVLKNYSKINRKIQLLAPSQEQLRYKLDITLQNPHLMQVLLEYLYTHQITAPTPITPSPTAGPSSSPSSPSPSTETASPQRRTTPTSTSTYTWRELYELAEQLDLHTLARLVKCALLSELTPDTVQSELLEWVYRYPALYPAYVKYAIDRRVDLLNTVQDWRRETAAMASEETESGVRGGTTGTGTSNRHRHGHSTANRESSDQWRRLQARRAAAAETYFQHTPGLTTTTSDAASASASASGPMASGASRSGEDSDGDGGAGGISCSPSIVVLNGEGASATTSWEVAGQASMVWSNPKYRNVVSRYILFLNGKFASPTGFESK